MKIILKQAALSLLKSALAAPDWAVSVADVYLAGALLVDGLPADADAAWAKSGEELARLSPADRSAYISRDREWAATPHEIEITEKQRECIKRCLHKLAPKLPVGAASHVLLAAFGFDGE